jgi:hypothetical protein
MPGCVPASLLNNPGWKRIQEMRCLEERLSVVSPRDPMLSAALIPEGCAAPQSIVSSLFVAAPCLTEKFLAALPARFFNRLLTDPADEHRAGVQFHGSGKSAGHSAQRASGGDD